MQIKDPNLKSTKIYNKLVNVIHKQLAKEELYSKSS